MSRREGRKGQVRDVCVAASGRTEWLISMSGKAEEGADTGREDQEFGFGDSESGPVRYLSGDAKQ